MYAWAMEPARGGWKREREVARIAPIGASIGGTRVPSIEGSVEDPRFPGTGGFDVAEYYRRDEEYRPRARPVPVRRGAASTPIPAEEAPTTEEEDEEEAPTTEERRSLLGGREFFPWPDPFEDVVVAEDVDHWDPVVRGPSPPSGYAAEDVAEIETPHHLGRRVPPKNAEDVIRGKTEVYGRFLRSDHGEGGRQEDGRKGSDPGRGAATENKSSPRPADEGRTPAEPADADPDSVVGVPEDSYFHANNMVRCFAASLVEDSDISGGASTTGFSPSDVTFSDVTTAFSDVTSDVGSIRSQCLHDGQTVFTTPSEVGTVDGLQYATAEDG